MVREVAMWGDIDTVFKQILGCVLGRNINVLPGIGRRQLISTPKLISVTLIQRWEQ